ncbi:MarR family transcriptional regulator [Nonomuraea typhae]|uniref:MarR family transcriptional regulator n=1 Tax=Nonomuraea typhae TaxID=2603600 RepID=UPI0015E25172|nr:MarR family transcriptional regulator [Nonomuraea typhae]
MATIVDQAEDLIISDWAAVQVPAFPEKTAPERPATRVRGAGPRLMGLMNERYVLDLIRHFGKVSRAELARLSGLSKPTVSSAVMNLENNGLVERSGMLDGGPGRAATLFRVRSEAGWVMGVDVRDGVAQWAISRLDGDTRATRVSALHGESEAECFEHLQRTVDLVCKQAGIAQEDLTWVVAAFSAAPCEVAPSPAGTSCHAAVDRALARLFGSHYLARRAVEMEMLYRYRVSDRAEARDMAFVSVGRSIEIGMIVDGRLQAPPVPICLPEALSMAGARSGGPRPRDCEVPPAGAVRTDLERILATRGLDELTLDDLIGQAGRGCEPALRIVAEMAVLTARLLVAVSAISRPELVVFIGRLAALPGFPERVRAELGAMAAWLSPAMEVAQGRGEAVLDGCLAEGYDLAWNSILDGLVRG